MLIGLFVFAQLSVAAYACPDLSGSGLGHADHLPSVAVEVASAATGVDEFPHGLHTNGKHRYAAMDPASPNLCKGHCQAGNQSADYTAAPAVSPALMTVMYTLPPADDAGATRVLRTSLLLAGPPRLSEPPHAILHCCFRD